MHHAVQQRRRGPGAERSLARRGVGKHRAQAEDVAGRPDFISRGLLGGHEPGRADHQARHRERGRFHRPGDAEVDDPRAVLGQQHVRRLEVAVHHARGVDRAQAFGQARGQRQQGPGRQRPVIIYRLRQRRPGHVGRGQPGFRPVDIRVHHHGGEHAADPSRGGDLPPEPHPEIRVVRQFGPDDLDRYRASARGDAEEHAPHATAAQLPDQPVRADRLRIPWLQSSDHAAPTSPNALPSYPTETTIMTTFRN